MAKAAAKADTAKIEPRLKKVYNETIRNALKEQEGNKPPKSFRAIFQLLQEQDGKPAPEAAETDDE